MELFKIEVSTNDGSIVVDIMAETIYHAIELLMFRHGMFRLQSDRAKYKLINQLTWQQL